MEKELQCIKIKDGLYLGNFKTAHDAEFLVTNKFSYIINCAAEIPNFYEGQGVKYLKFKLVKDKPHKLWDQTLKKLKKLDKFIQTSQQNSMCCLIHSYDGVNRSLVMLAAFLMNRFRWKLGKTLQFIRSKQIFIGLSEHYIQQLQFLEQILSSSDPPLTIQWRINYLREEQQLISKTFLNSQEIEHKQGMEKEKKSKRVTWKDLVEKQRKKQEKLMLREQVRERGVKFVEQEQEKKEISTTILKEGLKKKGIQKDKSDKKVKISGNKSKQQINLHDPERGSQKILERGRLKDKKQKLNQQEREKGKEKEKVKPKQKVQEKEKQQQHNRQLSQTKKVRKGEEKKKDQDQIFDEDQIINLIKKNLKSKKKIEPCLVVGNGNDQHVYNVTINNYIKPNINIVNGMGESKKVKKRPQSAWKKGKPI